MHRQFQLTGDTSVLAEQVQAGRSAVEAFPPGHVARAVFLGNLAASLHALSQRTADQQALEETVAVSRAAVAAAPPGHPVQARHLSNLGRALQELSEQTGDEELLAEAVQVRRRAIAITPAGDAELATFMTDLANTLRAQGELEGDPHLLAEAVELAKQAVTATPDGHADRASRMLNQATAMRVLATATAERALLEEASRVYAEAARQPTAPVDVRISAGYWQAATSLDTGHAGAALEAAGSTAALMSQLAGRSLARGDREHRLARAGGVPVLAAATAVAAGDYARGIELLEQTRGILLTEGMEARSDIGTLRQVAPDLADEYDALQGLLAELDRSADRTDLDVTAEMDPLAGHPASGILAQSRALAEARRQAGGHWDELLTRIRQVPGMEGFLAPPSAEVMSRQAGQGPIVYLYTSRWSHGALVLTADAQDPVLHIPLPLMTEDDAYEQINRLREACATATGSAPAGRRQEAQKELHDVLGWMWDAITAPVLDALGIRGAPGHGQPWPRIWWCPVGALAFLPLHAAGHHLDPPDDQPPRTVIDRAVSSYTATIRTISYARSRLPADRPADTPSVLVVSVPELPGTPPLPGVRLEAAMLQNLLPGAQLLDGPWATQSAIVAALDSCQIAHFACHGISDWQHTSASRLLVHDDANQPLTAAVIARQRLPGAELAYLSACSTAAPAPAAADEPTHVAAAFQVAGFPQVIATLWPVSDTAALQTASDFYANLTRNGQASAATGDAATALHHSSRLLRDTHPRVPTAWAAHVHFGICS